MSSDTRFARLKTDPRFASLPTKKKKVQLDTRFKAVLTDKRFKSKAEFNKYGQREIHSDKLVNPELARIYEGQKKDAKEKQEVSGSEEESENRFEWAQSSSSSSGSDNEAQIQEELQAQEYSWGELDDEAELLQEGNETNRLALQNINWDQFNAADLMKLFSSFCKSDMLVESVGIYPTEIGLEKMKTDLLFGPQNVFKKTKEPKTFTQEGEEIIDDIFEEQRVKTEQVFNPAALRKYELEKMQYFFAVIQCNSVKTANHLYNECSGLELELSGCKLDLRYIPDSLKQFPHEPKEVCSEVPDTYESKAGQLNRTMNHSKVELTWEQETVPREKQKIKAKLLEKKLEDFDEEDQKEIRELIGGSSDDEEKEFKERMKMFKVLLAESEDKKKEDVKLEINFKSAFDVVGDQEERDEQEEEVQEIEKNKKKRLSFKDYKEKKKEIKREKKRKKKLEKFQSQIDNEGVASKNELVLLMDQSGNQGQKTKDFEANPQDKRFKAIKEKRDFALDPTHKHFKKLGKKFKA